MRVELENVQGSDAEAHSLSARVARELVVTVLFADLRGFTGLAENRSPVEVLDLVNRCVGAIIPAVVAESGVVDKFLGDGVMAVFGLADTQDAQVHVAQAVRAAQRMQREIGELAPVLLAEGWASVGLGVGLETGRVVAGEVGVPGRLELTVLGDVVNVASRLTAGATAGEVVLGSGARAAVADSVPLVSLGEISIRGRRRPVNAWRLA